MKRILVIDESEVVRETLALILGREFAVVQATARLDKVCRSPTPAKNVDLLIFGVTPQLVARRRVSCGLPRNCHSRCFFWSIQNRLRERSKMRPRSAASQSRSIPTSCTRKLASSWRGEPIFRAPDVCRSRRVSSREFSRYLDFPFLSRSAATLVRRFAAARLPLLIYGRNGLRPRSSRRGDSLHSRKSPAREFPSTPPR